MRRHGRRKRCFPVLLRDGSSGLRGRGFRFLFYHGSRGAGRSACRVEQVVKEAAGAPFRREVFFRVHESGFRRIRRSHRGIGDGRGGTLRLFRGVGSGLRPRFRCGTGRLFLRNGGGGGFCSSYGRFRRGISGLRFGFFCGSRGWLRTGRFARLYRGSREWVGRGKVRNRVHQVFFRSGLRFFRRKGRLGVCRRLRRRRQYTWTPRPRAPRSRRPSP